MYRTALLCLCALAGMNLWATDGSNTQIILTYTCATTSTVVVSETNTYSAGVLQNPVNDVNGTMFPGSSSGSRTGAGTFPGSANSHYFVAGTRDSAWAADVSGSRGAWSSATTYALNDLATEGGHLYLSIQASNTNHDPATNSTWWQPMYYSRALHANTLHYRRLLETKRKSVTEYHLTCSTVISGRSMEEPRGRAGVSARRTDVMIGRSQNAPSGRRQAW